MAPIIDDFARLAVGSINDPIMRADGLPLCDDHKSFWIDTKAYRAVRKAGGDAVPVPFKSDSIGLITTLSLY